MPEEGDALAEYVEQRIRRPLPDGCCVVANSTPVVAFGDPSRCRVATVGLNPSRIEFEVKGVELDGPNRRFETLGSLGVDSLSEAPRGLVLRVWERCNNYFHGNPYRAWFDRLEEQLQAIGVSYYADTACHLDLSQWATDPTWNGLRPEIRSRLMGEDGDFLRTQIETEPITLLLLNGRSVINAFKRAYGVELQPVGEVADGTVTTVFVQGRVADAQVIGWSTNLQSSFGVTRHLRRSIANHLGTLTC